MRTANLAEFILIISVPVAVCLVIYLLYLAWTRKTGRRLPSISSLWNRRTHHRDNWADLPVKSSPFSELTFEEATENRRFALVMRENAKSRIQNAIAKAPGLAGVVVEGIQFEGDLSRIYFDISQNGHNLLKEGRAYLEVHKESRKILPTLKKTADGKFAEQVKGVRQSFASTASKAGNLIISAAHVISGLDVVQRLDCIKADIEFLVEARKIDQIGEIEAIYVQSKEAMGYSHDDRMDTLKENYYATFRLRTRLRKELHERLQDVKDPSKKSWLRRLFSLKKTRDENVVKEVRGILELVFWVDFCLKMQIALAMHTGRFSAFTSETLPNELTKLRKVLSALQKCDGYLSGKYKDEGISLSSECRGLEELITQYESNLVKGINDKHILAEVQ